MDIELERLTEEVTHELHAVMEDNPNMTEEDAIDWAYELADSCTPMFDYDCLMLAVNNLELIAYRDIPAGILGDVTPITVVRAAVFDYLKEIVYAEWHGHQQGKED